MLAMKCDLCGKFYDQYNTKKSPFFHNSLKFANVDRNARMCFETDIIDCCPECMETIKKCYSELCKRREEIKENNDAEN